METELKVNDEIILDIKRIGINGEGIAYYKKLAIFIPNAIPGEGIDVRITRILPNMAFGEPLKVLHQAPSRQTPQCPFYEKCGGCQTMHVKYEDMCSFKRDLLVEAITRYSKLNPKSFEIKKTFGMSEPSHYRFKSSLPLGYLKTEEGMKLSTGLVNPVDNSITLIKDCNTQHEILNTLNSQICEILDKEGLKPFDNVSMTGDIRYIVVRVSHFNLDAQVTIVTGRDDVKLGIAASKIKKLEHVVSVFESFNDGNNKEAIFGITHKIIGQNTITETIGKYKFELSPEAFFQLNPIQTENLYNFILKACKLSRKETVLDLYCGAGTIGIFLSKMAKQVVGVELNKEAIENAKQNALENKVENISFYNGYVDIVLPVLLKKNINVDVLVCDPPRTGLGTNVCETILKHEFKRVVYVSCNPSTLAKDLSLLGKKYDVKYIQPVDMFPMTSHVESICLLSLKDILSKKTNTGAD